MAQSKRLIPGSIRNRNDECMAGDRETKEAARAASFFGGHMFFGTPYIEVAFMTGHSDHPCVIAVADLVGPTVGCCSSRVQSVWPSRGVKAESTEQLENKDAAKMRSRWPKAKRGRTKERKSDRREENPWLRRQKSKQERPKY